MLIAVSVAATGCVFDKALTTEVTGLCADVPLIFEPSPDGTAVAVAEVDALDTARVGGDASATVDALLFTPVRDPQAGLAGAETVVVDVASRAVSLVKGV